MTVESENARDQRVKNLWGTLDSRKEGQIDLNGLKKGLKKMDHRESYSRARRGCDVRVLDTDLIYFHSPQECRPSVTRHIEGGGYKWRWTYTI